MFNKKLFVLILIFSLTTISLIGNEIYDPSKENSVPKSQMDQELAHFQFDNFRLSSGDTLSASGSFDKETKYYVQLGTGEYVDLPYLASKMGDERLAKDLTWGRYYNAFKIGFIVSLITGIGFHFGGAFLMYGHFGGFDGLQYGVDAPSEAAPMYLNDASLGGAIALFALSTFSVAGIITFAISMAKGYKYNWGLAEGKSLVTKYNSYIRKKYSNIGFDIQSRNGSDVALTLGFEF